MLRNELFNNETKLPLKMNLQLFAADGGDGAGDGAGTGEGAGEGDADSGTGTDDTSGGKSDTKTFTQDDLNSVGKAEKEKGKRSALKALGFEDEKTAKAEIEAYKAWKESQKTEQEKLEEAKKALESKATVAEQRAAYLENKLTVLSMGVSKDSVDDVLTIANAKVTDEKNLDAVLKEMKEQPKYKGFFEEGASSSGTGTDVSHGRDTNKSNGIGARLASSKNKSGTTTKSAYF